MTSQNTDEPRWAALFDWDGVVVDSGPLHELAWEDTAERESLPLFEGHFKLGFGMRNEDIIPAVLKWTDDPEEVKRLSVLKESLFRERVARNGILLLPGVRKLLQGLKEAGIPCAVASATFRENIECVLDLLDLTQYFRAVVSGDDVERCKPEPDIFLMAAKCLGVPPESCLVLEDSLFGMEARRAGAQVLAVATTNSLDKLYEADMAVNSLEEVTPASLEEAFFVSSPPSK